jgi:methylphosphotriester-DNA--protein-cysteine methyltransferase
VVIRLQVLDGANGHKQDFSSEGGTVRVSFPEDFGCIFFEMSIAAPALAEHIKNMETIEAFLLDVIPGRFPGRKSLAERYKVSGQTINRYFKKFYNLTVEEWFLRQKLEVAAKMLVSGRPIEDVSIEFGFRGVVSFSNTFQRVIGTPPAEWR